MFCVWQFENTWWWRCFGRDSRRLGYTRTAGFILPLFLHTLFLFSVSTPLTPLPLFGMSFIFFFLQSLGGMRPADQWLPRTHVLVLRRMCWSHWGLSASVRKSCVSMSGCRCGAEGEGTKDGWRKGGAGGDCLTWSLSSHVPFPQLQSIHSLVDITAKADQVIHPFHGAF